VLIDLTGKVAIVTGAGRGIGATIATALAAEGVTTIIADIRQDLLDAATAARAKTGAAGAELPCDVRDKAQCQALAREVEARFGRIDILVNNAGVASGSPVETLAEAVWDANLDTNLKGTFLMCQAVIPAMKRQKSGRILNAASFAALVPSLGGAAYASGKAAVMSLTRVLAGELGPHGITVNAYAPGMIPTEMNHFADAPPERQEALLDTLTLRRWGDPADIANLIVYLASDQAAYITGTTIDISGGKLATQMPWMAWRERR
jgi:3-oxoacyl-[acyl-carrier protein] reductase